MGAGWGKIVRGISTGTFLALIAWPRGASAEILLPNHHDPRARGERPAGDLGPIRFVTTGDFPPFAFLDTDGTLIGYHVDLARALCEELAAACTIQVRPFEEIAPAIEERQADAAVAGLAPSPALRRRLDFTDAYLNLPARFVARRASRVEPAPENLPSVKVAVVSGSAHEAYLKTFFPNADIVGYAAEALAREAVRDGAADLLFGDGMALSFWLSGEASRGCCAFRGGPYLDPRYFGEGFRIAYLRGNRKLRRALDHAMGRLAEKGRLAELYLRWFPMGFY